MAGVPRMVQPSTGAGKPLTQSPERPSQPPIRCSKSILLAGENWAAARRLSTRPPNRRSGPPGAVRPEAALAPRASELGADAREGPEARRAGPRRPRAASATRGLERGGPRAIAFVELGLPRERRHRHLV